MNRAKLLFLTLMLSMPALSSEGESAAKIDTLIDNSAFINGQFVQPPPKIQIHQSEELTLNLMRFWSDFEKNYDAYNGVSANVIALMIGDRKYRLVLASNKPIAVLSKATLEPMGGALPFSGFKQGESFMVVVGADRIENEKHVLNPMWIGMVEVTQ